MKVLLLLLLLLFTVCAENEGVTSLDGGISVSEKATLDKKVTDRKYAASRDGTNCDITGRCLECSRIDKVSKNVLTIHIHDL